MPGVGVGVVGVVHPPLTAAAAAATGGIIRRLAVVDPRPALALGLASPARGWRRGASTGPSVAAGREASLVGLRGVSFHGGALSAGISRRDALDLFVRFLLLLLGGLLLVVLLDVLALRVGLLRLGLVVVVADVLLPLRGEPGDGLGGSGRSAHEVVVLVGAAIVVLVLVGVAQAVGGPSRPAAAPGGRRDVVFGVVVRVLHVLLVVPGIGPGPARGPPPLASPRCSFALVVGGVPVDVRREAHRRGLSRRASRPGAHRVSMCIPDRTRTIPRRRCSESCAGPRARVRSWTFLNKFGCHGKFKRRGRVRLDRRVPLTARRWECMCLWLSRPSDEHIQTVRFVSGK